jgi:hypothetical protein
MDASSDMRGIPRDTLASRSNEGGYLFKGLRLLKPDRGLRKDDLVDNDIARVDSFAQLGS